MNGLLNTRTIICQNKDIDTADLNEDKVMMNLEKGYYFALNTIGSRIWDMIDEPVTIKDLIEQILSEYNVDYNTCEENVIKFLEELNNSDLIQIK